MTARDSEKQIPEILRHLGFKYTEDSWVLKRDGNRCEIALAGKSSVRVSWIDESRKVASIHFFDLADGDAGQNTQQWQSFVGW